LVEGESKWGIRRREAGRMWWENDRTETFQGNEGHIGIAVGEAGK